MSDKLEMNQTTQAIYDIYESLHANEKRKTARNTFVGGSSLLEIDRKTKDRLSDQLRFTTAQMKKVISNDKELSKSFDEVSHRVPFLVTDLEKAHDFVKDVKEIVEPFKKIRGVKNYVDQFHISEQDACQQLHKTSNITAVVETNKVADDLKKYFEKEIIPAVKALPKLKGPFDLGGI